MITYTNIKWDQLVPSSSSIYIYVCMYVSVSATDKNNAMYTRGLLFYTISVSFTELSSNLVFALCCSSVPLHALSAYSISLCPVYYLPYATPSTHFCYLDYQRRCRLSANPLIFRCSKSHSADGQKRLDGNRNSTPLLTRCCIMS